MGLRPSKAQKPGYPISLGGRLPQLHSKVPSAWQLTTLAMSTSLTPSTALCACCHVSLGPLSSGATDAAT
jgi:hypothetical protein